MQDPKTVFRLQRDVYGMADASTAVSPAAVSGVSSIPRPQGTVRVLFCNPHSHPSPRAMSSLPAWAQAAQKRQGTIDMSKYAEKRPAAKAQAPAPSAKAPQQAAPKPATSKAPTPRKRQGEYIDSNKYSEAAYQQRLKDREQAEEAAKQAEALARIHGRRTNLGLPRVSDEEAMEWSKAQAASDDRKRRMSSAVKKITSSNRWWRSDSKAALPPATTSAKAPAEAAGGGRVTRSSSKRVRFADALEIVGDGAPPPPLKSGLTEIFGHSAKITKH